ncbi:NADH-ubiquinone oxidoreductase-F iron-sulfur binding region domain-containing protein [Subtercola frigoramans]|uniref:NADH:ubiquinone oxidoreductase subunit F (NADH-binding) n=1 Tax=Subtercola frigoramans TaxID=120298 RepID=A0ABS2L1E9_9MICO|nr:NADH-ubiquinone oxidoreductase-F iron-sulfur binding region domain-containing protein [Subtercola frigoramans]MBM7470903.1 NADH:ubiquinone oxidoreductase subunit F (NADH-binding) [Subtercola frigoramans]
MPATRSMPVVQAVTPPATTTRLFVAGASASHAAHLRTYGPLATEAIDNTLLVALEASGLTGRGGAGFATWRKLAAADEARADRVLRSSPIVIANGAEGEPRSTKDATLLQNSPHLVIDGLLATASAIKASQVYLYTVAENFPAVQRALNERPDARHIILVEAAESFISGEASAVVNAIENGVALPTDRIRRLSDSGLKKRPTIIQNVETLAHIALIARYGARWFRSIGSESDPGTRLVTVSGDVQHEGVTEVAGDTPLRDILATRGVDRSNVLAVLVGGYHGTWVAADNLGVELSAAALAPLGGHSGAGVLYVLSKQRCGLKATADIVQYLANESARQCGPCMFGLPALASVLTRIASGHRDPNLRRELRELSDTVAGRGSCHHPDGTARLALSALSVFADDANHHLSGRCTRQSR